MPSELEEDDQEIKWAPMVGEWTVVCFDPSKTKRRHLKSMGYEVVDLMRYGGYQMLNIDKLLANVLTGMGQDEPNPRSTEDPRNR